VKRLQFTDQMKDAILAGRKTCTTRKLTNTIKLGDEFACVQGRFTPARDAFAIAVCTGVWFMCPCEIARDYYRAEGFESPDEYFVYWHDLNPTTDPDDVQRMICFEVIAHSYDGWLARGLGEVDGNA